jgi:hypothetical protein
MLLVRRRTRHSMQYIGLQTHNRLAY